MKNRSIAHLKERKKKTTHKSERKQEKGENGHLDHGFPEDMD